VADGDLGEIAGVGLRIEIEADAPQRDTDRRAEAEAIDAETAAPATVA
jgi:hypothetical protein